MEKTFECAMTFYPALRFSPSLKKQNRLNVLLRSSNKPYCASEIRTCTPALVLVTGAVVAIFGMILFCSK